MRGRPIRALLDIFFLLLGIVGFKRVGFKMIASSDRQDLAGPQPPHAGVVLVVLLLTLVLMAGTCASASDKPRPPAEQLAEQANAAWESGAITTGLELLDQGIRIHPDAVTLYRLRGDILSTFRDPQEAIQTYDIALALQPTALDIRWAKWSLLVRWGQDEAAVAELRNIARIDASDPLIHLRLAQELRKLDRLEESLESYTASSGT